MGKTLVCIIVYNRFENLKRWLECWKLCDQADAELVVVHNYDLEKDKLPYRAICLGHGIRYITRRNKGMDIGAFKYMITSYTMPPCDNILWITDDTIPMSRNFVKQFTDKLSDKVGISCMEISQARSPLHVRTTGFCMKRETAERLIFGEIVTKEDCYQFEHRGKDTLMNQVKRMGLRCEMVATLEKSPLWDTGNRVHLKRWDEHDKEFAVPEIAPVKDRVTFICPVFNNYPQITSSLICQTHKNWELYLIHDGPGEMEIPNDPRIHFIQTKERVGNYGHAIRAEWLQKLSGNTDYIVISNADNYYMPVFLERALIAFENPVAVGVYCNQIIHNYTDWKVMHCRLERGYIDCGQVMLKAKEAALVGWNSLEHSADWFFFKDIADKYGRSSFVSFPGVLFVHN